MSENEIQVVKLVRETPLKPAPMISNPWEVWLLNADRTIYDRVASHPTEAEAIEHLVGRSGFVANVEATVRAAMPVRKTVTIAEDQRLKYLDGRGGVWHDKRNCIGPCIAILDLSGIEIEVPE